MSMKIEMIRIPAGEFIYGEEGGFLSLPEFWIGKNPVTNLEYAQFVAATAYESLKHWKGETPPEEITLHPVTFVSQLDGIAFAEWTGKRLPTQEEWEKAARGTDGRLYPWGDLDDGRCNTTEAGIGTTSPVGQFSPAGDSPWGCVDMAGNVFEWTTSPSDKYFVLRGGSFNHGLDMAHCAFRVRHKPEFRFKNLGFRVAETKI
jgi:formylglycine-generating enzyme required for sulfatase activity